LKSVSKCCADTCEIGLKKNNRFLDKSQNNTKQSGLGASVDKDWFIWLKMRVKKKKHILKNANRSVLFYICREINYFSKTCIFQQKKSNFASFSIAKGLISPIYLHQN